MLPIFKSNLCHRNEVIKKLKVGLDKLNFHVLSTNVVVFDKAPRKSPSRTNLLQKVKKEHFVNRPFSFLCLLGPGKIIIYHLSPIIILSPVESYF